jgi:PadR family transcriptional regulator, regulatory protein AphA
MDARTLCLGVLELGDASGYEIKKVFEEGVLSHIYETSFGSIYPALNRLVEDGLAICTEMPQDKRPDKKVYSITPAGRAVLAAALQHPPAPDRVRSDFRFILMFGHLVPRPHLQRLIDQRINWYRDTLARIDSCDTENWSASARLFAGLGQTVFTAAAEYLEQNKHLLEEQESPKDRTEPAAAVAE